MREGMAIEFLVEMGGGEADKLIEEAIECYDDAVKIMTPDHLPHYHQEIVEARQRLAKMQ